MHCLEPATNKGVLAEQLLDPAKDTVAKLFGLGDQFILIHPGGQLRSYCNLGQSCDRLISTL